MRHSSLKNHHCSEPIVAIRSVNWITSKGHPILRLHEGTFGTPRKDRRGEKGIENAIKRLLPRQREKIFSQVGAGKQRRFASSERLVAIGKGKG